jgi:hypothetical protein
VERARFQLVFRVPNNHGFAVVCGYANPQNVETLVLPWFVVCGYTCQHSGTSTILWLHCGFVCAQRANFDCGLRVFQSSDILLVLRATKCGLVVVLWFCGYGARSAKFW